jgi:hypothetical protein
MQAFHPAKSATSWRQPKQTQTQQHKQLLMLAALSLRNTKNQLWDSLPR